jgi:hypothetical protein
MKKIVGIFAAAAVLATSVFAADVSAKVQLEGNLFKYGADKSISLFDIAKPSDQAWNPIINTSVSNDEAGAEFCIYTGNWEAEGGWNKAWAIGATNFKIWMKPFDGFKFIFGHNAFNLNQEHITWSKSDSGIDSKGYSINYSNGGISIDFGLLPGWGSGEAWMTKGESGDPVINDTAFKFQYGADFGTINAILVAKKQAKDPNLKFGVGYANNFSGINMFVNILGYLDAGKFNKLRAEIYAEGNVDAFSWKIFPVIEFYPEAKSDKVAALLWARVDYKLDACNIYCQIEDEGLTTLGKEGGKPLVVKPGVSGNIGGAGWDVALKLDIAKKVSVSVPVVFSMGW